MAQSTTVTLCGESLHGPRHICAFFDSRNEQYDALIPYFKEGLDQGEEIVTIMETDILPDHLSRLDNAGIPTSQAQATGQLKVLSSADTYTQDGFFAADRMFAMLEGTLAAASKGPFGRVRTCGDMEWALLNLPGTEQLMEYEARVNLLTPRFDCTLLCVYDVNRVSGRVITDVLSTHSHVVINGRVHANPLYMEPLVFLQTMLRGRVSSAGVRRDQKVEGRNAEA